MKRRFMFFFVVVAQIATVPAFAQDCENQEQFRLDLLSYLATVELGCELAADRGLMPYHGPRSATVDAHMALATASREQMTELCLVFEQHPELWDLPSDFVDAMEMIPSGRSNECLDPVVRMHFTGEWLALKLESAYFGYLCSAAACPVYAGVGVCAPAPPECTFVCPLFVFVDLVTNALRTFLDLDTVCNTQNQNAELENGLSPTWQEASDLHDDLAAAVGPLDIELSTRASEDALDAMAVDMDSLLAALDDAVARLAVALAALDEHESDARDLDERLRIEESLQEGGVELLGLRLPGASGGALETVREVVADSITMTLDAGEEVHDALLFFDLGDTAFNRGDHDEAFLNYQLAYRAAARE